MAKLSDLAVRLLKALVFPLRRSYTMTTRYKINGKEVTEAEWYANGGHEVERRLARVEKEFEEFDKW